MPEPLLIHGDCRAVLAGMEAESVQCVVTSPPYWSLRDYGLEPSVWGGDAACKHVWEAIVIADKTGKHRDTDERRAYLDKVSGGLASWTTREVATKGGSGQFCTRCGAWCGCLGLEPTPDLYVAHIVEVFRAVRRVLREDGVLWLNLGDCYTSGGRADFGPATNRGEGEKGHNAIKKTPRAPQPPGLKPKDLCEIPSDVVRALRADGWYLRARIPWVKRSAMPESADDRPNSAVEYVFQLTRSARYYFDMEAVRQRAATAPHSPGYTSGKDYAVGPMDRGGHSQREEPDRVWGDESGRHLRNGDLWFESIRPPHGMVFLDDEPVGLDVPPAGFSGWIRTSRLVLVERDAVSCGMTRIVSAGCPVRGHQDRPSGEHEEDAENRTGHTESHPAPERRHEPVCGSMCHETSHQENGSDSAGPSCSRVAIDRSKRSHKMGHAPVTNPSCTPSDETPSRTGDKSESQASVAPQKNMRDSSTWPDEMDAHSLDQTPHHTVRKSSLPIPPECTCVFYKTVTKEASHFATFPPKLVEPLIKSGTSERGCCPKCGKPWEKVVEVVGGAIGRSWQDHKYDEHRGRRATETAAKGDHGYSRNILGWRPACECDAGDPVPCTVLDPFSGAGTVALVAAQLGRRAIGIEAKAEYNEMARVRIGRALHPATFQDTAAPEPGTAPLFEETEG